MTAAARHADQPVPGHAGSTLDHIEKDVAELKVDVRALKDDVKVLKDDVRGLKTDMDEVKTTTNTLVQRRGRAQGLLVGGESSWQDQTLVGQALSLRRPQVLQSALLTPRTELGEVIGGPCEEG